MALTVARASIAVGAFVDIALALTLVVLLRRRKSGYNQMNSIIDRIMTFKIGTGLITEAWAYTIGTGLVTGAFALAGLVTCIGTPVYTLAYGDSLNLAPSEFSQMTSFTF